MIRTDHDMHVAMWLKVPLSFVMSLSIATAPVRTIAAQSADAARQPETATPTKLPFFAPDELVKLFEPAQFTVHKDGQPSRTLNYRLFKPTRLRDGVRFPIVIWMHGHGDQELQYHNIGQLNHIDLLIPDLSDLANHQLFILAVQCPEGEQWISNDKTCDECSGPCDAAAVTIKVAEQLMKELPIDTDRVYLVGISSGGTAAWEMAKRRPDFFAAVAPLASSGGGIADLELIKGIPIWAFHVTNDPVVSVTYDRSAIQTLLELGGRSALTETDGEPHDCWGAAFQRYNLQSWLLSQRRGDANCPLPGTLCSRISQWGLTGRTCVWLISHWPQLCLLVILATSYWLARQKLTRSKVVSLDGVTAGGSSGRTPI